MTSDQSGLSVEEYRALRATIRERGTARLFVTLITFIAWAALSVTLYAISSVPVLALLPLVVLAAGFEVVVAAHVGVERVGRYLQVYYERPPGTPTWEHVAMRFGALGLPSGTSDPLFSALFAVAAVLNLAPIALVTFADGPVVLGGIPLEFAVYALLHLVFLVRIVSARLFAARQRAHELDALLKDRAVHGQ